MSEQMPAPDTDVGIDLDAVLAAQLTEVQILREHATVSIVIINPVIPRIFNRPEYLCTDKSTAHTTAMDLQLICSLFTEIP